MRMCEEVGQGACVGVCVCVCVCLCMCRHMCTCVSVLAGCLCQLPTVAGMFVAIFVSAPQWTFRGLRPHKARTNVCEVS